MDGEDEVGLGDEVFEGYLAICDLCICVAEYMYALNVD